jgi:HK97 family phage prohead protease
MPIPKPGTNENREDFISRCMSNDAMQEYEREQRAGICFNQWRRYRRSVMEMFFKTPEGWEDKTLTLEECREWFKDHTDKDGNVTEEVLIFKDASLGQETDKSIGWTLSDDTMDRDFERFDSNGWNLKEFKKNPVLQWSHDSTIPAIGKVVNPRIKDNKLVGKIEFDIDDAFAQKIERKVRAGYISAGSVGFYPIKVEIPDDDKDNEKKPSLRLIYRKQELREFSICNVPANPNALAEQPEKTVEYVHVEGAPDNPQNYMKVTTDKPFLFGPDTSIESVKADIEELTIDIKEIQLDIENLKQVQMDMAGKIDKENMTLYQSIFDEDVAAKHSDKESIFDN